MNRALQRGVQDEDRQFAKTVQKAIAVLEVIGTSEKPLRIAEVALRTGMSRPTCHRIVQTLAAEGYVFQDPESGRLSGGFSLLMVAAGLLDTNRLRLESLPHLQALAKETGERTNLGILHRGQVLYLAGVEKPTLPTIYTRFGKTAPAHCCSLGKAILAYLPDQEVRSLIGSQPLAPQTANSTTSVQDLLQELEATRRQGYAIDREEHVLGSVCIAATILDGNNRALGAISISGRSADTLLEHVPLLRHTAEVISHVL
jgi:DNA-binding IclR family transcriptional regulator